MVGGAGGGAGNDLIPRRRAGRAQSRGRRHRVASARHPDASEMIVDEFSAIVTRYGWLALNSVTYSVPAWNELELYDATQTS